MSHQFFFSPHILDNLAMPESGFDVVQDITEPRLRLYITARGVKTFFTRKRVRGRDVRIIIGRWPDISIEYARAAVAEKITAASRPIPTRRNKIVFDKLWAVFVSRRIHRAPRSLEKLNRTAMRYFAPLMKREVATITNNDIVMVYKNIAENAGIPTANRMLEILGSVFKFAISVGHITKNPTLGIEKNPESRRKIKFGARELSRLVAVIKKESDPLLRSAFLMQVFAFAPKSAVFGMRWRDFDFNNDTWLSRPLSDSAVVLLRNIPQSTAYVFPSRAGHLTDPRGAWKKIITAAKLPGVQMNDVYKYLRGRLEWSPHTEQLRQNMNDVLSDIDLL
ncbi:MAG: integrase family protein [Rickettsiales bacterium]|jgi:hypothetical protein|nr:integrase family protein [Rickettsiales bacterium]